MKKITLVLAATTAFLSLESRAEKVDFAKDIRPILDKSCIECHGPDKQKGKLRLDTKEGAFKKTGDEATIVAGKADKSELYKRIILPGDHDDRMPSEGDPLSKEQTDLIRDWINQGAEWPESASPAVASSEKEKNKPVTYTPTLAEQKAVADLEASGIFVRPVAMNVPWRQASLNLMGSNITDKTLASLKEVGSLIDLNLAGTKITDQGLANLAGLTNLNRLHLEKTAVTDAGLIHLKGLINLSYLNLYSTAVSDSGLEHLKGLSNLKSLYLWQTKVTDEGVAGLEKALPKLQISRGWDLAAATKPKEEKKEEAKSGEEAKKEEKKASEEKKPAEEKKASEEKKEEKKAEEKKPAEEKKEEAKK